MFIQMWLADRFWKSRTCQSFALQLLRICHVPPCPQRFDEEHAGIHPTTQDVDVVPLNAQGDGLLNRNYLQIRIDASG